MTSTYSMCLCLSLWFGIGLFEWALFGFVYWTLGDYWLFLEAFSEGTTGWGERPKAQLFAIYFFGMVVCWPIVVCLGIKQIVKDIRA